MLRLCSINLKQALEIANNNTISSGCQGMYRHKESKNNVRLKQNETASQKDSPMFSMNGAPSNLASRLVGGIKMKEISHD
jgi:hypothetical protein